ncbi:hypothetical protein [Rhodospira trueperi]|uniref:Uncharacterized protein n=1 Tax=Rhodospira trueperi TaxID=69960 RepID=A0A1G7AW82_9PROT|nr:hypothetical protein [Rhodospira trueperi]SDE19128.1 hypothetical protein SAMN05421720_104119 [Rhodospira trueperi]
MSDLTRHVEPLETYMWGVVGVMTAPVFSVVFSVVFGAVVLGASLT